MHPLKLRILALMAEPPPPRALPEGPPEPGWSPHGLCVAVGEPLEPHHALTSGKGDEARVA